MTILDRAKRDSKFKQWTEDIITILVEECQVSEEMIRDWYFDRMLLNVLSAINIDNSILLLPSSRNFEFRIQGALGFGGKFWVNVDRFYVNCYQEDETPERLTMIKKANARLAKLWNPFQPLSSLE